MDTVQGTDLAAIIFSTEEQSSPISAHATEDILAEKYESIFRHGIRASKATDFYTLHTLYHLHNARVDLEYLRTAVLHTAEHHNSLANIRSWKPRLIEMREEPPLYHLWKSFVADNSFAGTVPFSDVLDTVEQLAADLDL